MKGKPIDSHRTHRVASLISAALMEVIRKGKQLDIRLLDCPISFTRVEVTRDLKVANCYFLPFNTNLSKEQLLDALEKSKFAIRDFVTKKINLKYSAELRFHFDYAFENVNVINQLLKSTKINDQS